MVKGISLRRAKAKESPRLKGGNSNASTANKKQFVTNFNYYLRSSSKKASDYETTTEFLINHICMTTAMILEQRHGSHPCKQVQRPTKPLGQLRTSSSNRVQVGLRHVSKAHAGLQEHPHQAYAPLWERCAKATTKNKIEVRSSNYDRIKNNPILLLKAIKEHVLNYQANRYSMSVVLDALRTLLTTKQKDGESLQDYT